MRSKYGKLCGEIDSAGTNGYHDGESADPRMSKTATAHGVDLSRHVSRRVTRADFRDYDFLLAMDESILRDMRGFRREGDGDAATEMFIPGEKVPDPYYGGEDGFERVYEIVEEGCDQLARRLGIVSG